MLVVVAGQVSFNRVTHEGSAYASDEYAKGRIEIDSRTDYARYPMQLTRREQPGPYISDYRFTDAVHERSSQWTECDAGSFNRVRLRTSYEVEVQRIGSTSELKGKNFGSQQLTRQAWQVQWRRCDHTPQPEEWEGNCLVVLETLWGANVSEHWGRSYGQTRREALALARSQGMDYCLRARNNNDVMKCTVDENQCSAVRPGE